MGSLEVVNDSIKWELGGRAFASVANVFPARIIPEPWHAAGYQFTFYMWKLENLHFNVKSSIEALCESGFMD